MSYNEPPPPPPPGYGAAPQPPYGGQPASNSGKAIASMVTGLIGLITLCCGLFVVASITALILGIIARKEIRASNGALKGDGMALTGIITGVIGLLLFIVSIALVASGVIDTNLDYSTS